MIRRRVWKVSNILSALAKGKSLYGLNKEDVLSACKNVEFKSGFFSKYVGAGVHHYILQESGKITDVDLSGLLSG